MVCGVDFIMEASPLPPSLPVSDIEMNKATRPRGAQVSIHSRFQEKGKR